MMSPKGSEVSTFKSAKLALVLVLRVNEFIMVYQSLLSFALESTFITAERSQVMDFCKVFL